MEISIEFYSIIVYKSDVTYICKVRDDRIKIWVEAESYGY